MDRTPAAAHASHDELLIARLHGGDVDPAERARALEQMTECAECASLFADLGAIAEATRALLIPPRPRDFRLTEVDAARLARRSRGWFGLLNPRLRRSLGGALSALGLAGLVVVSSASLFGGMSATSAAAPDAVHENSLAAGAAASAPGANVAIQADATAAAFGATTAGPVSATPEPASSEAPVAPPATSPTATSGGGSDSRASSGPTALSSDTASPGGEQVAMGATPGAKTAGGPPGSGRNSGSSEAAPNGIDARTVWLGGFGLLFAVGLALLLLPRLLRRRSRRT